MGCDTPIKRLVSACTDNARHEDATTALLSVLDLMRPTVIEMATIITTLATFAIRSAPSLADAEVLADAIARTATSALARVAEDASPELASPDTKH